MLPSRWNPWRGIILTLFIFAIEFGLHIVFAAKQWDALFLFVVIDMFFLSVCFAPIALILGGPANHHVGEQVIGIGTTVAVPLTMGFFWAVNDMTWSYWLIGSTALPMLSQILWYRWERGLSCLIYHPVIVEEE
tara:strand:- start:83 stop:484 length:402 start_codon:yes stop_codon:yes gene_type:complete